MKTNPVEDIVWLQCEDCGYGKMFMTSGISELPSHVCGTDRFVAVIEFEDYEEDEEA